MPRRKAAAEFAQDLKAIREKQAVALRDVQDRTKVPLDVLERFETNLLIENQHHNRVYIRALVRSYVGVLKLDEEQTLDALDMVLEGEYKRELAVAYLGLKGPKVEPPAPKPKAVVPADAPPAVAKPAPQTPAPPTPHQPKNAPPPAVAGRAARAVSPDAPSSATPFPWVAVAAGVVVIVLAAAVAFWALTREDPAAVPLDTQAAVEETPEAVPPPPPEPASVGEAIDVRIIAQPGPVQRIRLTVDADARRPYWIDTDSVRVVTVQERLIIEDQWGRFRLDVEGYPYPTAPAVRDAQNRIVLTKPSVQAFLDSVSVR